MLRAACKRGGFFSAKGFGLSGQHFDVDFDKWLAEIEQYDPS
jgi:hypothetical protein